jgi:hypothetical protein
MKTLTIIILASLCFSCGGFTEGEEDKDFDFSYSIDTVMVDAGDELIFHQIGLSHSDISNDQKQLFNFSPKSELEVIDLDSLKLLRKIVTEKEGPLGTGWPYAIQIDQTGKMVFYGFEEVRFFSSDLSSMTRYQLTPDALPGLEPEVLSAFNPKVADREFLYSIYENYDQVPQGVATISFEEMIVKKVPLALASRIVPFTYSLFIQGKLSNRGYEPINLVLVDKLLILSTAYVNEVFILDLQSDSVTVKTFHSELTADKKMIPPKTTAETINELEELRREGKKSVKFGGFRYDKTHRRFIRFSQDLDREIGDSLVFKNVLTVFDENLNQLGEKIVPIDPFSKKFFKDGKLWSYVNVEDELGFAVFTFDF